MSDRLQAAVDRARQVLGAVAAADLVAKGIWGSPAGKFHLCKRIVAEMPEHRVYVEPFAGGAQVLFAKDPSDVEVVADLDPEIAFAFRFAKSVTAEQLATLRRRKWVGDKALFVKLRDAEPPGDDIERFYRFAYLARFSFNKLRRGTMPDKYVGAAAHFVEKLEQHAPRLARVKVRCGDYEKTIDEFDGPDTFFYLDPPYAGYDAGCGVGAQHQDWDEERFGRVLRKIRGKFLCTYGLRGDADLFKGLHVRRWRHVSGVGTSQGQGLRTGVTLVATNYDPQKIRRAETSVDKTIWGSPAGKKRLANRLVALLPAHETYVEPFAGSAAVLFAKERATAEAIGDVDPEIARAYRTLKRLTKGQIERLRTMPWKGDAATYRRLRDARPRGNVAKLHRFLYLSHFSYGKLRGRSFNPSAEDVEARVVERVESFAPRLKGVRVHCGDYEPLVRRYDGEHTAFYLDPPYPGYDVDVGEREFDEERFLKVLKSLKGRFLLTYGVRGALAKQFKGEGFRVKRIRPPRSIRTMRGVGGPAVLTTLLVSNYDLVEKRVDEIADDGWEVDDWDGEVEGEEAAKAQWSRAYVNALPDSAFLYIEPGGHKDDEGKTVPRRLRHFPVRDDAGQLDSSHLHNAIARIPQSDISDLDDEARRALQDEARRLLAEAQREGKGAFVRDVPLIKGADPADERYVLGVVLEPEVVDAQGDIYSADEVRRAAHRFMEEFGGLGLMHRYRVNGDVKVIESYLAPADLTVAGTEIRKGTWLLAVRILGDALWEQVKDGTLSGFSIGGSARSAEVTQQRDAA